MKYRIFAAAACLVPAFLAGLALRVSLSLDYPALLRAYAPLSAGLAAGIAGIVVGAVAATTCRVVRESCRRVPIVGPAVASEAARLAAALDVVVPTDATRLDFERKVHAELSHGVLAGTITPGYAEAFRAVASSRGAGLHVEAVEAAWRRVFTLPELEAIAVRVPDIGRRVAMLNERLAAEALALDKLLARLADQKPTTPQASPEFSRSPAARTPAVA